MADLVERLRAPANWLRQDKGEHWKDAVNRYDRAPFEAAARIEQLEKALRPFAKAAEGFDRYNIENPEEWFCYGGVQGSGETTGAITVGDLRRARDALGEKP